MAGERTYRGWRALLFYGLTSAIVVVAGGLVLYTFFEKRTLTQIIAPEPLPKVSIVTADPQSKFAAAWVDLLSSATFIPTLVPIERFEPTDGLLALCNLTELPPELESAVQATLEAGGGVVVLGAMPPADPPLLGLSTTRLVSDDVFRFTEAATPVLARVQPGKEIGSKPTDVAVVEETPRMVVDARWNSSARAAIAHYRLDPGRVLWFGFDPSKLYVPRDHQLALLLRTSFRWVAGQPVSEGAIGTPTAAKTLTRDARLAARAKRMSFSVDRLGKSDWYTLRLRNNTRERLLSPTVKFWLPPNTVRVELGGSLVSRRYVTLIGDPDEHAVLVSILSLGPFEDRIIKLRAVKAERA